MPKKQVSITIDEDVLARLDSAAADANLNRSLMIEQILRQVVQPVATTSRTRSGAMGVASGIAAASAMLPFMGPVAAALGPLIYKIVDERLKAHEVEHDDQNAD